MARLTEKQRVNITILVAALGYFVDVFDLQLFSMLRVPSLQSMGLSGDELTTVGTYILNWQMAGMLVGGILWGVLGDRKGRVYVLFGTIILYSLGNITNAFVTTIPAYAATRFFTGLGLAGEIGAGITLASELLPKETRSYGSSVIVGIGVAGPLVAGFMADSFSWQSCYLTGGVLGLLLLLLRVSVNESGMFKSAKKTGAKHGHFWMLFNNKKRFAKYLACIIAGSPNWFIIGIIVIFSPEIAAALQTSEPVKASFSVMSCFVGLTVGGSLSGLFSQIFKNRKKVMAVFILGGCVASLATLNLYHISAHMYYAMAGICGFFVGYWTLFLSATAEQFGINLRATATSSAPNFVRATVIINSTIIAMLKPYFGFLTSIEIDGIACFAIALLALWKLPETFGRDLNFVER